MLSILVTDTFQEEVVAKLVFFSSDCLCVIFKVCYIFSLFMNVAHIDYISLDFISFGQFIKSGFYIIVAICLVVCIDKNLLATISDNRQACVVEEHSNLPAWAFETGTVIVKPASNLFHYILHLCERWI